MHTTTHMTSGLALDTRKEPMLRPHWHTHTHPAAAEDMKWDTVLAVAGGEMGRLKRGECNLIVIKSYPMIK